MNRVSATLRAAIVCLLVVASTLSIVPISAFADSSDSVSYHEYSIEERDALFEHARLGVLLGSLCELELQKQFPDAEISVFQNESDVVAALMGNRIDYGFVNEFYANRFMESNPGYEYVTPAYYTYHDCFAVGKGKTELRDKINEILAKYREDGTYDSIKKKWEVDRNYTLDDVPVREDGEVLRVACTGSDEPYAFISNDQLMGSAVESAMRVAYELGMRVEFEMLPFSSMIAAVSSGKVDISGQLCYTEERAKEVEFTNPYLDFYNSALAKKDDGSSVGFFDSLVNNFRSSFISESRWQLVLAGLGVTVLISGGAFLLATVLGILLCALLRSKKRGARTAAQVYVKLVSGIPVLVWLMVLYYIVFADIPIHQVVVAIICFGLQASAGMSGVFMAGLDGVDKGQIEAALAMGFSRAETMKRIVLPQAAARIWGLYSEQLGTMIKATSIVGYVAIQDLTRVSDIIRSRTFQAFFPLIATAVIYFVLIALCSWALSRAGRLLDPKLRSKEKVLEGVVTQSQ